MQRNKKIEMYLAKHPQATEKKLQKKFGLSRQEALALLSQRMSSGETAEREEKRNSWRFFRAWWANDKRIIITLVTVAFCVRGLYLFFLLRHPLLWAPLQDAAYYLEWAKEILAQGFLGDKVFFTEPLYAYLLALFLKVSGVFGAQALVIFQMLLGALFPVAIYFLGKRLINRQAGIAAGILSALYGPLVFYEGLLLKTSLEVFLLPWFLLLVFLAFEKKSFRYFFFTGLLLGGLSLVKGNNLIFLPTTLFLIFFLLRELHFRQQILRGALFSLGVLLFIVPITWRNYVVGHDFVPTNYSVGLVVYQGSWWGGDGSTAQVPRFLRPDSRYEETDAVGMAEAYAGKSLKPSGVSSFWMKKAAGEILSAPLHFMGTLWNKVLLLLNHSEFNDNYSFDFYRSQIPWLWFLPGYFLVGPLALLGIIIFFRQDFWLATRRDEDKEKKKIFLALFGASILVLLFTTVNARYRMPLTAFFLVFSGATIYYIFRLWEELETKKIFFCGLVLLLFLIPVFYPLASLQYDTPANTYHALGYAALERGDYEEAKKLFDQTIAIDPRYGWAYGNLMLADLALNDYGNAENALRQLIILRSDDLSNYDRLVLLRSLKGASSEEMRARVEQFLTQANLPDYDPDFYEGERYLRSGDEKKAEEYFLRSFERSSERPATLIALAALKKKQGETGKAREYLTRLVAAHPEIFPARYNLANIYIEEKNFTEVARLLQDIYDFTPELGNTWYNYAVALIKTARTTEAVPVIQGYIKRYENDPTKKTEVEKFKTALQPTNNNLDNLLNQGKK